MADEDEEPAGRYILVYVNHDPRVIPNKTWYKVESHLDFGDKDIVTIYWKGEPVMGFQGNNATIEGWFTVEEYDYRPVMT